jgi:hypothetical protein
VDEDGVAKAGMGVTALDYDGDGDEEIFVANLERQSDSFYRNEAGQFYDRTASIGLGVTSRAFTRFGVGFHDFDQDGWLDLYIANGRVTQPLEAREGDPYSEVNLLFRGSREGKMTEVEPRGGEPAGAAFTSRAVAFGDLDGDGSVDAVVANRDARPQVLRNVVRARGHRVSFRVREASGRDAFGARVELRVGERVVHRVVRSAYGYQSASDATVHVGLGPGQGVEGVTVVWADGTEEIFGSFPSGATHELRRGQGS